MVRVCPQDIRVDRNGSPSHHCQRGGFSQQSAPASLLSAREQRLEVNRKECLSPLEERIKGVSDVNEP